MTGNGKHAAGNSASRVWRLRNGRLWVCMAVLAWARGAVGQSGLPVLRPGFQPQNVTLTPGTNSLNINQSVQRAVIEWQDFSIVSGKSVTFGVPSGAVTINKVVAPPGYTPPISAIHGSLSSNGQLWLINPAGVLIGPSGSVTAAGFLASTLAPLDAAANPLTLTNPGPGSVINRGLISTPNGYTVLAARRVENSGRIEADGGRIGLGVGNQVVLSFDQDKLLSFQVEGTVTDTTTAPSAGSGPGISNIANPDLPGSGTLRADGGKIWLSARVAANVISSVVNVGGTVQARSASSQNGEIVLDAGLGQRAAVSGVLDVSSPAGGNGGTILVKGKEVVLESSAELNASALAAGNGGTLTLETPLDDPLAVTRLDGALRAQGSQGGNIVTRGFRVEAGELIVTAGATTGPAGRWTIEAVGQGVGKAPDAQTGPLAAQVISDALAQGTDVMVRSRGFNPLTGTPIAGNLSLWEPIEKNGGAPASLTLRADNDVVINADITHGGGGPLTVNLHADAEGNGAGSVVVGPGQVIKSGDGVIRAGGGGDPASGFARNVMILGELDAGEGEVIVRGKGTGGGPGVMIGSDAQLKARRITLTGEGGAAAGENPTGVRIEAGAGLENPGDVAGDRGIWISGTGYGTGRGVDIPGPASPDGIFAFLSSPGLIHLTGNAPGEALSIANGTAFETGQGGLKLQSTAGDIRLGSGNGAAAVRLDTHPAVADGLPRLEVAGAGGVAIHAASEQGFALKALQAVGPVAVDNTVGDLRVGGTLATENASPEAITLAAGSLRAAGQADGGNVVLGELAQITTGANGRVRVFSGSLGGSDGLQPFAGEGSGRFRYGSSLQVANFTAPLGTAGRFVIYRERPTLTLKAGDRSLMYGEAVPVWGPQVQGLRSGDSVNQAFAPLPGVQVEGALPASGRYAAGEYALRVSPAPSQLGYAVASESGRLKVLPRPLRLDGLRVRDKVYDGGVSASIERVGQLVEVLGGDAVMLDAEGARAAFNGPNAGVDANVRISGLKLGGEDAGNYLLNLPTVSARIQPRPLAVSLVGAPTKLYDGSTRATLGPDNFRLQGLVGNEALTITQTRGQYAQSAPGEPIALTTQVSMNDLQAGKDTLLANYDLPAITLTGSGSIKAPPRVEQLVGGVQNPGPAPVSVPAKALEVTPTPPPKVLKQEPKLETKLETKPETRPEAKDEPKATREPAKLADSAPADEASAPRTAEDKPAATPDATPAPRARVAAVSGAEAPPAPQPINPPPASPVPQEKPPTPRDSADATDRTLAAAATQAPPKSAPQAKRQPARRVEVGQGLSVMQAGTRTPSAAGAGHTLRFSMNGNVSKW